MTKHSRSRATSMMLALLLTIALVGAACGESGSGSKDDEGSDQAETDLPSPGGATSSAITIKPSGDPTPGGTLIYGLEAESDGWDPTKNRWAVGGVQVASTVFDALAAWNADSEAVPYLAESFTPNADFTEWVITLRTGISFHNGDPLTSAAVKKVLDGHLASPLTKPTLGPVESVEIVDDLSVKVFMKQPWAVFPAALTAQVGFVPAPAQLDNTESGSREPIGTGPFVFEEWVLDSNFVASRNDSYWRKGLPYLAGVEFRPIPDNSTRAASVEAGTINLTHTTDDDLILKFRDLAEAGDAQIVDDGSSGEETFILLNTLKPPLDDVRVRTALAHAIDKTGYIDAVGSGLFDPASGPFNTGSTWYDEAIDEYYPQYDPEKARELIAEYEAEEGDARIVLGTTPVPANEESIGLIAAMWTDVGIDVEQKTTEQATFIIDAVTGNYEANLWRQFGFPDPDPDQVWWRSENAHPVGQLSLNMARNKDDDLDAALDAARATDDPAERKKAYIEVQQLFAKDMPYVWLNHTLWAMIADTKVRNLGVATLPDGSPGLGVVNGAQRLTDIWLEE